MNNNVYLMKQPNDPDCYLRLLNSPEMEERREVKRLRARRIRLAYEIGKIVLTVIVTMAAVGLIQSVI